MVSVSKLLQVVTRLFEVPQPSFTVAQAHVVVKFVTHVPLSGRGPTDTLNMMKIVVSCPHASKVFAQHDHLCSKVFVGILIGRSAEDAEHDEGLRRVIRLISVNTSLPTPVLLTMAKRISHRRRETLTSSSSLSSLLLSSDLSGAVEQDDALAEELLHRVVCRMPKSGQDIYEDADGVPLTQKEMHKRKSREFEKPELVFLLSSIRHITSSRAYREKCGSAGEKNSATSAMLPPHIVEPVIRCVESLPTFCKDDAPLRADDWIIIASLIGSCDMRLHDCGKRLWKQKTQYYHPKNMIIAKNVGFASWIVGFTGPLRGEAKRDALELWIDLLTDDESLVKLPEKSLRLLLVDITTVLQGEGEGRFYEQLIAGGNRVLSALEIVYKSTYPSSTLASMNIVQTHVSFVKFFPPLDTKEETARTCKMMKTVLLEEKELDCEFIRETVDYVRYLQRCGKVDQDTVIEISVLVSKWVLQKLEGEPLLGEKNLSAITPAMVTFASLLRTIQGKESSPRENEILFKELMNNIIIKILNHQSLQYDVFFMTVLLQTMELLDFTSHVQYTTKIRELILVSLRSVQNKVEDLSSHTAQHCIDLTLRAIRFHVMDSEILVAISVTLRHATHATVLQEMSLEQQALTVERISTAYRELSRSFSTSKPARRLAKHMLNIVSFIASDKVPLNGKQHTFGEGTLRHHEWRDLYRCAQNVWILAVRVALLPIPRTPIDRYVISMLQFARTHWISEKLVRNNDKPEEKKRKYTTTRTTECSIDEEDEKLSRGMLDNLLPILHQLVVLAFTDKTSFYANLRRNKIILSSACEILEKNKNFLSPCVWFYAQRVLSSLPTILPGQLTSLQTKVLQLALKHTLRNVRACDNYGSWHLSQNYCNNNNNNNKAEVILSPKWIGDMFSCADIIDDADLRGYLISLLVEQLETIDEEENKTSSSASPSPTTSEEEGRKSRFICLKKTLAALRRGSVLYY